MATVTIDLSYDSDDPKEVVTNAGYVSILLQQQVSQAQYRTAAEEALRARWRPYLPGGALVPQPQARSAAEEALRSRWRPYLPSVRITVAEK